MVRPAAWFQLMRARFFIIRRKTEHRKTQKHVEPKLAAVKAWTEKFKGENITVSDHFFIQVLKEFNIYIRVRFFL